MLMLVILCQLMREWQWRTGHNVNTYLQHTVLMIPLFPRFIPAGIMGF